MLPAVTFGKPQSPKTVTLQFTVAKLQLKSSKENVTTTWGTALQGRSAGKAEKHRCKCGVSCALFTVAQLPRAVWRPSSLPYLEQSSLVTCLSSTEAVSSRLLLVQWVVLLTTQRAGIGDGILPCSSGQPWTWHLPASAPQEYVAPSPTPL